MIPDPKRHVLGLCAILSALLALRCGASANDESGASEQKYHPGEGESGSPGMDASADSHSELPPEEEVENSYRSPVATSKYVWVANPTSGQVAYVDVLSLEVRTVPAGNRPTYVAGVPSTSDDIALAINVLSQDATILRKKPNVDLEAKEIPLHPGANSWAVSPQGRWAIAWGDYRQAAKPDPLQGYQDMTVIDMTAGAEKATRVSVGYHPVAISYSADESRAFVVSQDGVSVVELTAAGGPVGAKLVPLSANPLDDPGSRDVSITPEGSYAFVRRDGSKVITIAALEGGELSEVELPADCTDFDLSPDGTRGLAVLRDTNQVAILPVPEILSDLDNYDLVSVPKATIGSVSVAAQAPLALLYTNAKAEERITLLSFGGAAATVETLKLHAPVLAVFLAGTGEQALVVHQPVKGAEGAFSTLSIQPALPAKIVTTLAPISAVAITPNGDRALVAERKDSTKVYGAYLVRGATQQVDRYELSSPPSAVGAVLAANRAYIAQEHPEGRITFLDLDTGLARTLTGFELAARVVDGSKP